MQFQRKLLCTSNGFVRQVSETIPWVKWFQTYNTNSISEYYCRSKHALKLKNHIELKLTYSRLLGSIAFQSKYLNLLSLSMNLVNAAGLFLSKAPGFSRSTCLYKNKSVKSIIQLNE